MHSYNFSPQDRTESSMLGPGRFHTRFLWKVLWRTILKSTADLQKVRADGFSGRFRGRSQWDLRYKNSSMLKYWFKCISDSCRNVITVFVSIIYVVNNLPQKQISPQRQRRNKFWATTRSTNASAETPQKQKWHRRNKKNKTYRRGTAEVPQKHRRGTAEAPQRHRRSTAETTAETNPPKIIPTNTVLPKPSNCLRSHLDVSEHVWTGPIMSKHIRNLANISN